MSKNLHADTLRLLKGRPASLSVRQISEDTGLNYDWLKTLLRADFNGDPGVKKMQTLHDYLVSQQIDEAV